MNATADPDGHSVNPDLDDAVGLVPPTSALSLGRFTNALPRHTKHPGGTHDEPAERRTFGLLFYIKAP